jgi:hypothetical protein
MSAVDVCLTSAGMKNLAINNIGPDFTFILGSTNVPCQWVTALFLSAKASRVMSVDSSVAEYVVETAITSHQFNMLMSLGQGSPVRVDQTDYLSLLALAQELGNPGLFISLLRHFQGDLPLSQLSGPAFLDLCTEDAIEVISSRFYRLTVSELDEIPVTTLFYIVSHDSLRVSSEDELYSYICSRIPVDPEYSDLLRCVRFEYLSIECIANLIAMSPSFLNRPLWDSISRRLMPVTPVSPNLRQIKCRATDGDSMDGIIAYLTRKHRGNVDERGVVTITSKSVASEASWKRVRNVADLASHDRFISLAEPNQWVCWDFHELRVRPTLYKLADSPLKNWVLEGSLDAENWVEIDRRTQNPSLYRATVASFPVKKLLSHGFRYIRLTQTGRNHRTNDDEGDILVFRCLELFGTLFEPQE